MGVNMYKILIFLIVFSFAFESMYSQFGIGERLKRKMEEKIENKTEEAFEKALEGSEEEEEEKSKSKNENHKDSDSQQSNPTLQTYSKFDFIPGERIIFYDDFSQDNIGDFPAKWNTNGSGEVVTTSLISGKWLKMSNDAIYVPDFKYPFPENFTIEFDLIGSFSLEYPEQVMGVIKLEVANLDEPKDAINGGADRNLARSEFELKFADVATAWVHGYSSDGSDVSNSISGKHFQGFHAKPIHFSISVNKQRYRIWVNQTKVFDLPRMMAKAETYNIFRLNPYFIDTDKNFDLLISNIKFAEGTVDARSKLITEGKLVTNGITFDTGSDKIKPESYPVIKSIADVLKSNESVNIMIVGYTDSDGNSANNQKLSEKRALAVMEVLVKEFGINPSRIKSSGKGDSQPLNDNSTAAGKALNRRVEFIKL